MAGESQLARTLFDDALASAEADPGMSPDTLVNALLTTVLGHLAKTRSRADLTSLVQFELDAAGEDEFVITRGS